MEGIIENHEIPSVRQEGIPEIRIVPSESKKGTTEFRLIHFYQNEGTLHQHKVPSLLFDNIIYRFLFQTDIADTETLLAEERLATEPGIDQWHVEVTEDWPHDERTKFQRLGCSCISKDDQAKTD